MSDCIFVYVTVPDGGDAQEFSRQIVEKKLAACANIFPVMQSIHLWKGITEERNEVVVILKTRADLFDKLSDVVKKVHPDSTPCIVAFPIMQGNPDFLEWIRNSTADKD